MKDAEHDKSSIKEALNNTRERRVGLEQRVAEARENMREADQKLQIATDALKECYAEIATLKSMQEQKHDALQVTTVESQCLGQMPALYEEGFAACYW